MFSLLLSGSQSPRSHAVIYSPGQVWKETILKEKQEVKSVSHRLLPQPLPVFSPLTCIVLLRGRSPRLLNAAFQTSPRARFRNTMQDIFFLSSMFLLTAAGRFEAAVLKPLAPGNLLLFFPRRDLGPNAKSTKNSFPPSFIPDKPLTQGGKVPQASH